ncbi:hypothetical protein ACHAPI_011078 [Fusarium lateritium]
MVGQPKEAESRACEDVASGDTDPSSYNNNNNNNSNSHQQQQQEEEDHHMEDARTVFPGSHFYNAFGFGRGRGQDQNRGQGGNTIGRGGGTSNLDQNSSRGFVYHRGPRHSRGGRGKNAGSCRGNFAVTRYKRDGHGESNTSRGAVTKTGKLRNKESSTKATGIQDRCEETTSVNILSGSGQQNHLLSLTPDRATTIVTGNPGPSSEAQALSQKHFFQKRVLMQKHLFEEKAFKDKQLAESKELMQRHLTEEKELLQRQLTTGQHRTSEKVVPDNLQAIAKRQKLEMTTVYTDHKYPLKKGPKPKENPRVEHVGDEEGVRCVLCRSKSHAMGFCLSLFQGELKGCPLCHDPGHRIDQCQTFLAMSMDDKVRILVDCRTNMPPLDTQIPWWDYMYKWLKNDASRNERGPFGFPWSVEFTRKVTRRDRGTYIKDLQARFDSDHDDRSILPVDTDTSTFSSIYLKYWSLENKPFPERIREMTGEVAPLNASATELVIGAGVHDQNEPDTTGTMDENLPFTFDVNADLNEM